MTEAAAVVIEKPQAANILTSENREAFMNERMGIEIAKPAEEVKPVEKPAPKAEEVDDGDGTEATPEQKKANNSYKKLLAQRNAEREKNARLESELAAARSGKIVEIVKPEEFPGKPDQSKYTDAFKYAEDLADWKVTAKLAEAENTRQETEQRKAMQKRADQWKERVVETEAEIEDYDEVIQGASMTISNEVREALLDSDIGPRIAYTLAKDPEALKKLNAMTVGQALREIGRMEARLEKAAEKDAPKEAAKESAKEVSKAPAPISPLKATNAPQLPVDEKGEFTGSIHEFKKLRREGKLK